MQIGGLQKFSLIDYPGKVAATIFTQGCNFRCPFCYNSELALPEQYREPIPESTVFEFLEKRKGDLEGVVVTGGEPTIQKDLSAFLGKIKELGYLIKLDTNGSLPDVLKQIIDKGLVDYIAMDVKASINRYEILTGTKVITENIRRSIKIIIDSGVDYEFRTTVIKTLFKKGELSEISDLISGAKNYRLQKFQPKPSVLDKGLLKADNYTDEEIEKMQKFWNKHRRF